MPLRVGALVHCVRPRREFGPAADPLWYLHNFALQSEQIPASRTCVDKKVGKEATPASSALALRGLPCAARSLRVGQNSLRELRSLRSNNRPKSDMDARCRALPQSPVLLSSSEGGDNISRPRCARLDGLASPRRCEARRRWNACEASDVLLLGPLGESSSSAGLCSSARQRTSKTDFAPPV